MVSNTRLTLNLQYPNIAQVAYAMQGDRLSRAVVADLIDGSTPWAPPAGAYGLITASKPDGTFAVYDTLEDGSPAIVIDGSTVTLYLAEQVLADAGAVKMSVAFFTSAGARLTTFRWTEVVAPEAVLDRVVSGNYISILTAAMAQAADDLAEAQTIFDQIKAAYGAPLTANTAVAMTDTSRVYVYTGTTGGGFTNGHWYYWDGTAWADGGNYNSTGFTTDTTLTIAGAAADAKATGDQVSDLKSAFTSMQDALLVTDAQAITWHQGSIDGSTGTANHSEARCYTDHVKVEHSAYVLTIPSGYKCYIYEYTSNSTSGYVGPYISGWQTGTVRINVAIGHYIRFVCAYTDNTAITPSDITGVALTYSDYTDPSLSMSGKAADAKVAGDKIGTAEKNAYDSILNLMAFCPNLFSVYSSDYQPGKGYSGNTGSIVNATANCISGYIRVSAGDYLQIFANKINVLNRNVDGQYRKIAYYDTTKTWVKTETYSTNTTGPDALRIETDGYIRVMFRLSDLREIFVSTVRRDKLVDLIVFAGQSNMAGRGETSSTYPDTAPAVIPGAGYEFKSITDPTQLYPLTEPFGYAENAANDESGIYDGAKKTGDIVPAFVNAYYSNNGGIPVVGVSASEGGSSSSEWLPETGNNFLDLAGRVSTAQHWLVDNGYAIRHQYCVWCQGESDGDNIASGTETLEEYKARTLAIFTGLISLGMEKVLLIRIGHHNSGLSTRYKAIIDWQTGECKTNENLVLVSCDFAAMRAKGMMKDSFHYYQIGYNITGNSAGINSAFFATTGKEPTMYDPENDNLYYSHKN